MWRNGWDMCWLPYTVWVIHKWTRRHHVVLMTCPLGAPKGHVITTWLLHHQLLEKRKESKQQKNAHISFISAYIWVNLRPILSRFERLTRWSTQIFNIISGSIIISKIWSKKVPNIKIDISLSILSRFTSNKRWPLLILYVLLSPRRREANFSQFKNALLFACFHALGRFSEPWEISLSSSGAE